MQNVLIPTSFFNPLCSEALKILIRFSGLVLELNIFLSVQMWKLNVLMGLLLCYWTLMQSRLHMILT